MNYNNCLFPNKYYFLFLLLSHISLNDCILEIPLKSIKIKRIQKYSNIIIKEPKGYFGIYNNINRTILINEGKTILNEDILFLANIKIGSNNQSLNLMFDTGSYIIWVPKLGSADKYKINNHYDPSKSTSSYNTKETFELKYGTGSCRGFYYTDEFKYINNENFKVKFGVANKTDLDVDNADGIIGLSNYYEDENLSFIHMLKKYNLTDSLSFSFKFENDLIIGMTGKLIVGKHKDFSNNETVTCPLLHSSKSNNFWACEINSFGIENSNHKIESQRDYNFIFDTGTNIIILPLEYYNDIKNELNKFGCETFGTQYIQIKCSYNNRVNFKLKINGNYFTIPKDLIFYENNNIYYSKLVFIKDMFIIGNPFFLIFHTLFDRENEQLVFYPENHTFIIENRLEEEKDSEKEKDKEKDTEKDIKKDKDNSNTLKIIVIISVIIIFIIGLSYLIYRIIKKQKSKREFEEILPSSNYFDYKSDFL